MKKVIRILKVGIERGLILSVLAICFSLISCEEWFGDDDDDKPEFQGQVVAEHLDTP
jgi:hypothetical protein